MASLSAFDDGVGGLGTILHQHFHHIVRHCAPVDGHEGPAAYACGHRSAQRLDEVACVWRRLADVSCV
eukprot:scaffold3033_cov97-Phaeocystis_antarctica.AAC.1